MQRQLKDSFSYLRKGSQQLPRQIQGLEDGSVLVATLGDELPLELLHEFDEQVILGG